MISKAIKNNTMPKLICLLFIVICGCMHFQEEINHVKVDLPEEIHLAKPTDTLHSVLRNDTLFVTFTIK